MGIKKSRMGSGIGSRVGSGKITHLDIPHNNS